jgi:hypothetical protein
MRALTRASRALCYLTAAEIDRSREGADPAERKTAHERASLLMPVAKAFSSDAGIQVASLGVQVHGGMGYIEETGAAQHLRDARITAIYEGTNGIQAIDLVTRKLPLGGGASVKQMLHDLRQVVDAVNGNNDPAFGWTGLRLSEALDSLEHSGEWLLAQLKRSPEAALAGATPYLHLFGIAAGGVLLAQEALAARQLSNGDAAGRVSIARFFAEHFAVTATALEREIIEGSDSVRDVDAVLS